MHCILILQIFFLHFTKPWFPSRRLFISPFLSFIFHCFILVSVNVFLALLETVFAWFSLPSLFIPLELGIFFFHCCTFFTANFRSNIWKFINFTAINIKYSWTRFEEHFFKIMHPYEKSNKMAVEKNYLF